MKTGIKLFLVLAISATFLVGGATLASAAGSPTCSTTLGIEVHGQHIVGDYITGIAHTEIGWPPAGQVGEAVAGRGPVVPGGPGPGFHFPNGFAPGASFCNSQSQSPGLHPGLG